MKGCVLGENSLALIEAIRRERDSGPSRIDELSDEEVVQAVLGEALEHLIYHKSPVHPARPLLKRVFGGR